MADKKQSKKEKSEEPKLYIDTDGFVRTNAKDTISSNIAFEQGNRGSGGACNQDPDKLSDKK